MQNPFMTPEELADAYVHLLLSQEEAAAFEERCAEDESYQQALDSARRRKEVLEGSPTVEASEKLVQRTLGGIEEAIDGRSKRWRTYRRTLFGLTTAAVVLIAAFQFHYANLRPSPYDLRILGQGELLSGSAAAMRVALIDQRTGQEVRGVPVSLTLYDPGKNRSFDLNRFITGEGDSSSFTLPEWADGDYQLRVVAGTGRSTETLTEPVRLTQKWQLMLSTDKPVYQPGQMLHLRALALRRPDLKPVEGEEIVFSVADPKGNIIFKEKVAGSAFGIGAADCQLATEIIEGDYRVVCCVGEVESEQVVTVEKYVLPKFGVTIELDKPYYQPGETVVGAIQADYFFGQPVSGGEVTIEARGIDVEQFKIASLIETTSSTGSAEFQFTLPETLVGREQEGGNAEFSIGVTVTDTAGQSYTKVIRKVVTSRPIDLQVIPEFGTLVEGLANRVYLFATYVDGRPAEVDVSVNSGEYRARTNKLGVAVLEVNPAGRSLGMTLVGTDDEGVTGRRHVTLFAGKAAGEFVVRSDRVSYEGGDTIKLTALGGGVEPVFVDLIKDGQTVTTRRIEMNDGGGELELDLPAELFGSLQLVSYRFSAAGLPVRKSRSIFVRQARTLQIEAILDEDVFTPGATAQLKLKLTDEDGEPVVGAVSLSAVDEAVFAVLGRRAGMEEAFFLLERELLEPVYALYNWDPFGSHGVPEDVVLLEQAIFSRIATAVVGSAALPYSYYSATSPEEKEGEDVVSEAMVDVATILEEDGTISVNSPFTLAAATYIPKRDAIQALKRAGQEWCLRAWWSLFGVMCLVGWGTALVCFPRSTAAMSVGLAVIVVFLVIPATLLSRHAASKAGLDLAIPADMVANPFAMDGMMGFAEGMGAMGDEGDFGGEVEESADLSGEVAPRVRQWFPETLLWRPEIITDENGYALIEVPLADSITTWRVSASAVSSQGQLGNGQFPVRVFQPFFVDLDLPVSLTRNDRIEVPVVIYNYLDESQEVKITLQDEDWFSTQPSEAGSPEIARVVPLQPREIKSIYLPLQIEQAGRHTLEITALGSGMSDAIRREIEVVPDGVRSEFTASGTIDDSYSFSFELPAESIEASQRTIVKLYPSTFSQLVEGLDAIFQMPSGCFEQTSSTTYPNVLALDYLRRTRLAAPEVEAKARQYIHVGYQRLVSFEVGGGGFDWFGNPPANQTLTAYGLMEFQDMAAVHDVDPQLIVRTRRWLLSRRQADGSWKAEPSMLNDGLAGSVNRGKELDLAATAFIGWAVFGQGQAQGAAQATLDYLLSFEPASLESPYLIAVIANCIAGIDPNHGALVEYLGRLEGLKQVSADGKQFFWVQPEGEQTAFYGDGRSGDIETTAMATLALMKTHQFNGTVDGALRWLVAQKDGRGTWHSTQATVLSLKALVEAAASSLTAEKARKLELVLNGELIRTVEIPADQSEVMQQIDVSESVLRGKHTLEILDRSGSSTGFQISFRYHLPKQEQSSKRDDRKPLEITIDYDRQQLEVDESVTATAVVRNQMGTGAPMVIMDLPIPGGFQLQSQELDDLVRTRKIERYQITPRKAVVYLRGLRPFQRLELRYRLRATMPVRVSVPKGSVYEYYNPDRRGESEGAVLEVTKA